MKKLGLMCAALAAAVCPSVRAEATSTIEIPRIVAHRGDYYYDDNALGGFQRALDAGVTGFETDVQMTFDGGFVLMHDESVTRTTGESGNVAEMTFEAVTNLTLKVSGEHVPSLQQLADLFRNRSDVFVEFEMKSQGFAGDKLNAYVDGVHEIVSSTMPAGTYIFTSFSESYLSAMKTRHPTAQTAYIRNGAQTDDTAITKALELGCSQVSPGVATDGEWVTRAKAQGLKVALWMVEDLATWQACKDKGVDTVTSNHPIELRTAVTNYLRVVAEQSPEWNNARYFTNDLPWTINAILSGAEGLGKWGAGSLTLSGASTFTGDVLLAGGEINLTTLDNDKVNTQVGALGNPRVARTVVVSNATLRMVGKNSFGGSGRSTTPVRADLKFYNSTLDLTTNFAFNAGNVYLHNSVVKFHGGLSHWGQYAVVSGPGDSAFWGAFYANNLYFSGDRAVTFENEETNLKDGDYRKAGVSVGKFSPEGKVVLSQQGVIDVPDMTGDDKSDVIFKVPLIWTSGENAPCSGFRKTGAGTLEFGQKNDNSSAKWSNYTGDVDVVEGTLKMAVNYVTTAYNRPSVFGAARYPHTFTVHPGATLQLAASDLMGQFYATNAITLHVKGGTFHQSGKPVNGIGRTIFENATVKIDNTPDTDSNYWWRESPTQTNRVPCTWPSIGFNQGVTFKGTCAISDSKATYHFGTENGTKATELNLDGSDITLNGRLIDAPAWYDRSWPADEFGRRYITKTNHPAQLLNMRKTGSGTLTLNNVNSPTKGRIEITEGVLRLGKRGNSQYTATQSPLGDLSDSNRVALVMSGGVLEFRDSDTLGQAACVNYSQFIISNATIRSHGNWANSFPYLTLYNAEFDYTGGLTTGEDIPPYGAFIFAQRVTWDGTRPYNLPFKGKGSGGYFALGFQDDFYEEPRSDGLTNWHGKCEFRVMDITRSAASDVTIGVPLKSQATWTGGPRWGKTVRFRTGLLKTGPGTLSLNGTDPEGKYYEEATRVAEGTLLVDTHRFRSTNVLVQAGAYVGGTGTVKRVTLADGAGLTAAPGQTVPLTVTAIELPANGTARLDVPCLEDLTEVTALRVPVAQNADLANVKWTCTVNGEEPPDGYRASAVVSNGILYGVYVKSGLTLLIR